MPDATSKLPPPPPPGSYSHVELYSSSPEQTKRFYADVFGWKIQEFHAAPGETYTVYHPPQAPGGGIVARRDGPFKPPAVLTYLQVADVDAAAARITQAGGKILVPRYDIPHVGAFVVFEAPGGIVQAAWQGAPSR